MSVNVILCTHDANVYLASLYYIIGQRRALTMAMENVVRDHDK